MPAQKVQHREMPATPGLAFLPTSPAVEQPHHRHSSLSQISSHKSSSSQTLQPPHQVLHPTPTPCPTLGRLAQQGQARLLAPHQLQVKIDVQNPLA